MSRFAEILEHVGNRPGMYFGRGGDARSIHDVAAFITGYQHGMQFPDPSLSFTHFTRWVAAHYRVIDGPKDGFVLILEHVGGDEGLAFDEFFGLLPAYVRDWTELGPDGIHAHYGEVMIQISEKS